jgi:cytochrome c553
MKRLAGLLLATVAGCGGPPPADDRQTAATVLAYDGASASQANAGVAHGERLSLVLGCTGCHGKDLRGDSFRDEKGFGSLYASNLTRRVPHYSDAELEKMLRGGRRPDGSVLWVMPSEMYVHLSEPDMAGLIAYLRTLQPGGNDTPPPKIEAGWRAETASGKFLSSPDYVADNLKKPPFDAGVAHARGRMITMTACTECHAPNLEGFEGDTPSLDLVGAYSAEQFATLMRTGKPVSGKELRLMSDVARTRFSRLTDAEVADLYGYLNARAQRPQ